MKYSLHVIARVIMKYSLAFKSSYCIYAFVPIQIDRFTHLNLLLVC